MKHRKCLGGDLAEQGKNSRFTSIGDDGFYALGKAESVLRISTWITDLDSRLMKSPKLSIKQSMTHILGHIMGKIQQRHGYVRKLMELQ